MFKGLAVHSVFPHVTTWVHESGNIWASPIYHAHNAGYKLEYLSMCRRAIMQGQENVNVN